MPFEMNFSDKFKEIMGIVQEKRNDLLYGGDPEKAAQEITNNPNNYSGGWMDKEDAARHLIAVGGIAQRTSPTFAKILAKANEAIFGAGSSEEDTKMDEHNNALALSLYNAKDFDEIKQRVAKMMESAQYRDFSDKNKPVFLELDKPLVPVTETK